MQITSAHFGSVYSGFPQEAHHTQVLEALGSYVSRWPGGHLAEVRTDVYDITTSAVFDPTELYSTNPDRNRLDLNEVLNLNNEPAQTVSIVLPTYRYADNLEQGAQDLQLFLDRLISDSELSNSTIRLEIGSEYYASDVLSADGYGEIALRFASIIDANQNRGIDFETVVQMGRTVQENSAIISHFSEGAIGLVDNVTVHMLPINLNNLYRATHDGQQVSRFGVFEENLAEWRNAAVEYNASYPTVLMTAWAIGAAVDEPGEVDLNFQDYGARGGIATLALFTEAVRSGVEEASAWGVGETGLSSLGRVIDGEVKLTHAGVVFNELRDSVIDLSLAENGSNSFDWQSGLEIGTATFVGLGKLVFYAGYGSDQVSGTANLANRAPAFSAETAKITEAKRILTTYEAGYQVQNNEYDRLSETPVVLDLDAGSPGLSLNDTWLSHQQTAEYEVLEVTVSWQHQGTSEAEELNGYSSADWFDGGDGDDTINGFGSDDTLDGSAGNDVIFGGSGTDLIDGGIGNDLIRGGDGEDVLHGGEGNDLIFGGDGDDTFSGDDGDDTFHGGSGADLFSGGAGNDQFFIDNTGDYVSDGGLGYDVASINSVAGLTVSVGGWTGVERVNGFSGADTIDGTAGTASFVFSGGNENDSLLGGSANDTLLGGAGNDVLFGGDGDDQLLGGTGRDTFSGGGGNDVFIIDDAGDIVIDGGSGIDKAVVNNADGVSLLVSGWMNVERINGFDGDDIVDATSGSQSLVISGGIGDDTLIGSSASDILLGGQGDDVLSGGDGSDRILGSSGFDTFDGGAGDDVFFVGESADFVSDGGTGFDTVVINNPGGLSISVSGWTGVERINGFSGADFIDATSYAEDLIIAGGASGDTLVGGDGNDTVYGGGGSDFLAGAFGDDALVGDAGNDSLHGGTGDDFLLGRSGDDVFIFSDNFGQDIIKDFVGGEDALDFSQHSKVDGFNDLSIAQSGSNTLVSLATGEDDRIILVDVNAVDVGYDDFVF